MHVTALHDLLLYISMVPITTNMHRRASYAEMHAINPQVDIVFMVRFRLHPPVRRSDLRHSMQIDELQGREKSEVCGAHGL